MRISTLLPLALLLPSFVFGAPLAPYDNPVCHDPSIRSVRVPTDHENPSRGESIYRYQRLEVSATAPWVVTFPGGPGGKGIGSSDATAVDAYKGQVGIPKSYNWIRLDPRGRQCNRMSDQDWPDETVVTWQMANDVAAVIQAEKILHPILFGFSYGTPWATITASLLESKGGGPQALLLGGVMGAYGLDGAPSILDQLNIELEEQKSLLSPEIRSKLDSIEKTSDAANSMLDLFYRPIRVIEGKVKNIVIESLTEGASAPGDFSENLSKLISKKLPSFNNGYPTDFEGGDQVHYQVGCREIKDLSGDFAIFSRGKFIFDSEDFAGCVGRSFTGILDSARYPVHARIVYFQGDHDPATPIVGARYHLAHHSEAERVFLRIPGGGHSYLSDVLPDCLGEFWNVVLGSPVSSHSFESCAVKPVLTYLSAGM